MFIIIIIAFIASYSHFLNININVHAKNIKISLLHVPNNICSCAVSLFTNMQDELLCYEKCKTRMLDTCPCDSFVQSLPLRILCYRKHCYDEASFYEDGGSVFSAYITVITISSFCFLFMILLCPFSNHYFRY